LAEEGEDIDALNNSILASCVPSSQTFFDHVLSIMKVEESLLSFYCQRKVKKFNFDSFISRQKATDKIVNEFKMTVKDRKVVIAMRSGGFTST
jgi:predicted transcriptional regulator